MKNLSRLVLSGLLLVSAISAGLLAPQTTQAFEHRFGRINEGRWVHDRHHGRLGWWWVAGPSWNFYPRPYAVSEPRTVIIESAPQPQPPVTIIQAAPPVQVAPPTVVAQAPAPAPVLYYCRATGTYYPETMSCPGGWSTQVAGAPPSQ